MGSSRRHSVHSDENTDVVNYSVLIQEGIPKTCHTTQQTAKETNINSPFFLLLLMFSYLMWQLDFDVATSYLMLYCMP